MKIGIIVGTIRDNAAGIGVGQWAHDVASKRTDAEYELVKLVDYNVPLLTDSALPGMANGQYADPNTQKWGNKMSEFDGFVFVTPEYNHSIPGAFKNAFDSLGVEWQSKPIGFVSYGASDGHRAVEHWRSVVANFSMHDVRSQVSLSLFTEFGGNGFQPSDRREAELNALLDELAPAAKAMKAMRG